EVDFVIAEPLADRGGLGERLRIGGAELQHHWVLRVAAHGEQPLTVAVQDRRRRNHLGVEQRMPGELAVEGPAMPVRPIHHRRDAEFMPYVSHIATFFSAQSYHSSFQCGRVSGPVQLPSTPPVKSKLRDIAI